VGGHHVALVLRDPLHQAVVRVAAPVVAVQPGYRRVLDYLQRQHLACFFQLRHDTIGDVHVALGHQQVHGALDQVQLVLYGVVDEIGVQEDVVRRSQLLVEAVKHGGRRLDRGVDLHPRRVLVLLHLLGLLLLALVEPRVFQIDHSLLRELSRFGFLAHYLVIK